MGTPTKQLVEDVLEGANVERVNPANAYERFFVPTGKIVVRFNKLDEAAYTAAVSDTVTKLMKALDDLEQAVMTEDYKNLTKSGRPGGTAYLAAIKKFRTWLKDPVANKPPYQIFMKGNKKLPFWAFSTLPGVTCPGAGDCLVDPQDKNKRGWCYSFSAWRNITPYFRQLQNTLLIRLKDKSWIEAEAKKKFKSGQVVRLYVDGDFDSKETLTYWMHFCERFPQNQFYGYSKSWHIFVKYDEKHGGNWPENYVLNLSNGTMWETLGGEIYRKMSDRMLQLKCVRGRFIAIKDVYRRDAQGNVLMQKDKKGKMAPIISKMPKLSEKFAKDEADPRSHPSVAEAWRQHMADVKWKAKELQLGNVFPCPGKCYACLGAKIGSESWTTTVQSGGYGKHACGEAGRRENIVIAVH
jgi:hypothetical protein